MGCFLLIAEKMQYILRLFLGTNKEPDVNFDKNILWCKTPMCPDARQGQVGSLR